MNLITPTEREARISIKNHEDGIVIITETLLKESKAKAVILKLGSEGTFIHSGKKDKKELFTDTLESLNKNLKDVAGAGDSMLVGSSLSMALGASIWESALVGSIMSAIQISRVGNIPIHIVELLQEIDR